MQKTVVVLLVKIQLLACILQFHTRRKNIGCSVISLYLHQNMEICLYICFILKLRYITWKLKM